MLAAANARLERRGEAEGGLEWPQLDVTFWMRLEELLDESCGLHVAGEPAFVGWFASVIRSRPPGVPECSAAHG